MGRIIYRKNQQWPQNFSIGGKLEWKRILGGLCLRNHTFTDITFLVGMTPIPLKSSKKKQQIAYKGTSIKLSADISAEAMKARRDWQDILKVIKGKNLQSRLLYPARLSFRINGEIKTFTDKQKLKEFSTTKPALQ